MRLSRSEHHAAASALIRGLIRQGQAIAAPPEISAMLPYDLMLIAGQKPAQPAEGRFVPPPRRLRSDPYKRDHLRQESQHGSQHGRCGSWGFS